MRRPNRAWPTGRWATQASRLLAKSAVAILLAFGLLAPAAAQGTVSLEAVTESPGALSASTDTPLSLSVMAKSDGNPVAGRTVRWKVAPEDAVLSRNEGVSSAGGKDMPPLGTASTLFTARTPGSYVVTASTQSNPGCTGENCATWSEVQFRIEVSAAAARSSGSGKLLPVAIGAGAAALLLASNNGDGDRESRRSISKVSGDGQSGAAGGPLSLPLVIRADNDDRPASGESITWTASGGATLSANSTSTDSSGQSQVNVTNLGPGPGPVTVTAKRTDSDDTVSFSITVLNKALVIVSGNGQSAPVNTTAPSPLVVEARLGSSPQSGIGISWNVVSGDASIASVSNGGNTNGSGQSSATIDLGPTPGPVVVSATRNDAVAITQTFTLNSTLVRTLDIVSGDNQTAAPNTPLPSPLVVNAQDNGANAAGVTINWMATGGATLSSPTSVTDGFGQASINVTSTGPGPDPFTVTAVRSDDGSAIAVFNGNVIPPVLSIYAGDGQSGLTGSPAEDPLEVLLVDGGSNPVSGQTITWIVTSGSATLASGSSVTDGAGHATMTFTYGSFPGPITINASAYGGAHEVDFSATANTADALQKTSGDGQAANPGTVLAPFVVTIDPPAGATDLSGVPITFTITSTIGGSLSTTSTVTDINGQASTTLTLGLTPGTVSVLAQVVNGPSATFTATVNGSLVATALTIVSGDGQTLSTGQASAPMIVELKDGGTPLQGLTVNWSTNNGSLSTSSSVTDSNGRASTTVTPSAAGAVVVTADFDAYAQYTASSVSFTHNTTLASLQNLSTDQEAVAVALDNACVALSDESSPDSGEQDLIEQCEALADASDSDPDSVADAIDEMLPDVAQTQTQTGEASVDAQFDNLNGRINTLRAGGTGASFGGLSITTSTGTVSLGSLMTSLLGEDEAAKPEETGFSRWGFFASGNIGRGETDANGNAPRYDFDIRGLTVGIDYRKTDNLVLGVALGYTNQDTTLSGGQGSLDMSGYSLSGYATLYRENSWYIDGVVSWGSNDYKHRRRVVYTLPGQVVDQIARASSGGTDTSASVTLGRDFNKNAWNFGVYGRAQYSRQHFDSFTEKLDASSPGAGLALRIDDRSVTSVSSVIGGKASYVHSTDWGVLMPMFGLEWQREYSGDPDAFRAFLVSDPTNTPIVITGRALDNSYFRMNFGLSFVLTKGRSGFIQYDRIFARDGNSQDNLTLGLRIEF